MKNRSEFIYSDKLSAVWGTADFAKYVDAFYVPGVRPLSVHSEQRAKQEYLKYMEWLEDRT